MDQANFHIMAEAVLLYHKHRNSLFADHFISDELDFSAENIRKMFLDWFHASPEEIVSCLEPDRIRRRIAVTEATMGNRPKAASPVRIQAMTAQETDHGAKDLSIHFQFTDTILGPVIIASTTTGICYLAFSDQGDKAALGQLKARFPNATLEEAKDDHQRRVLSLFNGKNQKGNLIQLHLKGTPYQVNTWKKLLEIPYGGLMSYSALAKDTRESHALGAAVGSNPVAYLIPCHRTVRATGEFGEYHWGRARKAALICLEASPFTPKERGI